MKYALPIFILTLTQFNLFGQDSISTDNYTVSIDWQNEINRTHKYKDIYSQKDEEYIKWIYETSKNVTEYTSDQSKEKMYYHDGRGNDPIVFTIEKDNESREEVYKNAVKPTNKLKSTFSIFVPKPNIPRVEGSLQEGITTYFSDSSKGYEMGIEMDKNRDVKIEILDTDQNLIHIIEDRSLDKGWNHYKWDTKNVKTGNYILKYTVDQKVMTQTIEISDRNKSLLGKFIDWLF